MNAAPPSQGAAGGQHLGTGVARSRQEAQGLSVPTSAEVHGQHLEGGNFYPSIF